MGKLSRTSGHSFERQIAREMTEVTGAKWERVLTETRDGNSGDVICTDPRVQWAKDDNIVIQCKNMKKPNPLKALEEAQEVSPHGVAFIHRKQHQGVKAVDAVVMTKEMFYDLIR